MVAASVDDYSEMLIGFDVNWMVKKVFGGPSACSVRVFAPQGSNLRRWISREFDARYPNDIEMPPDFNGEAHNAKPLANPKTDGGTLGCRL